MSIRRFEPSDTPALIEIVRATGVFRDEEIDVAAELLEVAAIDPTQKDYIIYSYVDDTEVLRGYYCVGPTPMTKSTFDLYWIAVDPTQHGTGIGFQLLQHCEELVRSMGGSLIMVETSSLPKYDATRKFYVRNTYAEEARIRSYYAPGDDLVVYSKHITEA
jgi:ribosomal protein S18 acetylase RimI-like enzyme